MKAPLRAPALASAGAIGLAFVAMLWWTWGTWPDVIVDFGRELYVPWRLLQGEVLFRDIAWLNGPLSPYVNAFWFGVLGVGFRSAVAGNLILLLTLVWLVFQVTSSIANRLAATLATLTFIAMFGFSVSNYNYLSPYSHELTHGVLLSFAALACFSAFLKSGSLPGILGTGFALGLVFLTKAEVFLALAVGLSAGMVAAIWTDAIPPGRRLRTLRWLFAATLAPIVITLMLFLRVMSLDDAWLATAGAWRYVLKGNAASLVFYQRIAGVDEPAAAIRTMLSSALVYAIVFGAAALASVLASKRRSDRAMDAMAISLGFSAIGVGARLFPLNQAARPLPLFLLMLSVRVALGIRRRMTVLLDHSTGVVQLTFVTFALCLLARMPLMATFYRYGFVLAMPATIVLVVALVDWIPGRLSAMGWEGRVFRGVSLGAWLMLGVAHLAGTASLLGEKQFEVGQSPDRFRADARAPVVNAAVHEITSRLSADETLLVLPEGIMLNYLSRRVNPTPYVNFMPVELALFGESNVLADLRRSAPDYVALVHKDTSEYGVHFFGRDYGQRIQAWVTSQYRTVETWGGVPLQGERFGISLLERIGPK